MHLCRCSNRIGWYVSAFSAVIKQKIGFWGKGAGYLSYNCHLWHNRLLKVPKVACVLSYHLWLSYPASTTQAWRVSVCSFDSQRWKNVFYPTTFKYSKTWSSFKFLKGKTTSSFSISVTCAECPVCFLCRVVVLESRPTDNPTALSNLYILAGHENSYWASPRGRMVLRKEDEMPNSRLSPQKTSGFCYWSQDRQVSLFSLTPAPRSLWLCSSQNKRKPLWAAGEEISNECCYFAFFSLFRTVDWVTNKLSRGIIDKSAIKTHKNLWLY